VTLPVASYGSRAARINFRRADQRPAARINFHVLGLK